MELEKLTALQLGEKIKQRQVSVLSKTPLPLRVA